MCGIVGLFLKNRSMEPLLGSLLSDMLVLLTDRGPDSAGVAIYGAPQEHRAKITVQSHQPKTDFAELEAALGKVIGPEAGLTVRSSHAIIHVPQERTAQAREMLSSRFPHIRVMSFGERIEIYKETGLPQQVSDRFRLADFSGTHGIGHTRMATESAVTTLGAHPFSTGADQCLVHNGSLSNHNNVRRELRRDGIEFETDNDTEVAAAYVSQNIGKGRGLGDVLNATLNDLDGFFTFVVGTKSGFGVVRDPIACKPAVLAENDDYVAFGSEYRAFAKLPGLDSARVWEPEPATTYFWEH